jgi:hypothetical protein
MDISCNNHEGISKHDSSNFKVVILGCQRSATTLLHQILNTGEIFMMEENWILSYFQRERWHAGGVWHQPVETDFDEQLIWDRAVKGFVKNTYEIYYSSKRINRHNKWGIKAPGLNMARTAVYLAKLFPEVHFIITVRHPFDVFSSMLKSPKMMNNLPADFTQGPTNSPDLVEIFYRPHAYWGLVYSALDTLIKTNPNRCHIVQYEEMINDPLTIIKGVCEFLNIIFNTKLLEPFCRNISNSSVVSMRYNDYLAGKFVTVESSVGRWKNHLKENDILLIKHECAEVAKRWGYDINV